MVDGTEDGRYVAAPRGEDADRERRAGADRRGWMERRGSGARSPLSKDGRAYAFREFDAQRRSPQDRRLYGPDDEL